MRKLLLALLLASASLAHAQVVNAPALVNQRGTTTPTPCTLGQLFFDTDATAGNNLYGCTTGGNPGTWTLLDGSGGLSNPVTPAQGGTGIANNNTSTLTMSGNFATTLTRTNTTNVTLPTSGTLATLAGTETLSAKTLTNPAVTGQPLSDAATVAWNMASGNMATVTVATAGRAIGAPTNMPAYGSASLRITYSGTGTVTSFNAVFKWAGGVAPTMSNADTKIDMVTCNIFDGTNLLCGVVLDVK